MATRINNFFTITLKNYCQIMVNSLNVVKGVDKFMWICLSKPKSHTHTHTHTHTTCILQHATQLSSWVRSIYGFGLE